MSTETSRPCRPESEAAVAGRGCLRHRHFSEATRVRLATRRPITTAWQNTRSCGTHSSRGATAAPAPAWSRHTDGRLRLFGLSDHYGIAPTALAPGCASTRLPRGACKASARTDSADGPGPDLHPRARCSASGVGRYTKRSVLSAERRMPGGARAYVSGWPCGQRRTMASPIAITIAIAPAGSNQMPRPATAWIGPTTLALN
jgi:hypothetical protein